MWWQYTHRKKICCFEIVFFRVFGPQLFSTFGDFRRVSRPIFYLTPLILLCCIIFFKKKLLFVCFFFKIVHSIVSVYQYFCWKPLKKIFEMWWASTGCYLDWCTPSHGLIEALCTPLLFGDQLQEELMRNFYGYLIYISYLWISNWSPNNRLSHKYFA